MYKRTALALCVMMAISGCNSDDTNRDIAFRYKLGFYDSLLLAAAALLWLPQAAALALAVFVTPPEAHVMTTEPGVMPSFAKVYEYSGGR